MKRSRRALSLISAAGLAVVGLSAGITPAQGASADRIVKYHGYQVAVPSDWKMVDLAADPAACVRFDQPAVYLGHPAAQQNCPAHLVGRTAGLVIEPLNGSAPRRTAVASMPRTATAPATASSSDNEIQVAVEDAGVLVTAVHGFDQESSVRQILGKARLTSGGTPAKLVPPTIQPKATTQPNTTAATVVAPGNMINQQAFDQCTAPSLGAMNAWKASPFKAVGIYISGSSRSCSQANLTASWVSSNAANGWSFMPIDVGYQAPCGTRNPKMSFDPATARNQGAQSAGVSAQAALNLGIGPGSALYSDIEAYPTTAACKDAVLSYVSGWTNELRARGFLGGVYSSAGSGGRDLASGAGDSRYTSPDHIWFAWWNGAANTDGGQYISSGLWVNHQRLHQYKGDHNETWGGVTINIDSNFLDVSSGTPPPMTDGVYRLRAEAGGFDLDVVDCQSQNGADVRMWDRIAGSPCQKWHIENVSGTTFKIVDGNTGKALEASGCSTADVTPVDLWDYAGADCQTWTIEPIVGGAYKIIGTGSGKSLDVAGCSTDRGADVIIWPFHGGSCQRWYFDPA
ncbi:ricin-type beta-trefoil lectin protein [Kribbella voronezhensis]|uniref:Ricin-type beta-trefoil lectin protein n=1 Tax=Kribbella voronezhensis TaxID=2512212 RepID=A0A4R7SWE7_9ACTN|nr:glycoside hydrolase domain-containing protein [Kribbella voronezhensis]TDU83551.1 ricin-type beta-trefoil lectin protein [Kribbella voronezhensis]